MEVDILKITVLMEDLAYHASLLHEHGLSFYIETKHHKLLLDTGASEKTWENAKRLGIDLGLIDTVVISHGHYDHAGGLLSFVEKYPHVKVYIHKLASGIYTHYKNNEEKYIGMDERISQLKNIIWVYHDLIIDDELSLFTNIAGRRLWPQGNLTLHQRVEEKYIQDEFRHEQCLVIHEDQKYILLSGCAHNGILNIIDSFKEIYQQDPDVVLSGFHMQKTLGYEEEDIKGILQTAQELKQMDTIFYTGHCTGIVPYDLLKNSMKDKLHYMYTGNSIIIGGEYEES